MHFVLTPTDPSVAHANLDLQEMEKTAQVVFSVVRVFSYGSRNFISSVVFLASGQYTLSMRTYAPFRKIVGSNQRHDSGDEVKFK